MLVDHSIEQERFYVNISKVGSGAGARSVIGRSASDEAIPNILEGD
jgi:hypothetical protein